MNLEERKEIQKSLVGMSELYGRQLSPAAISIMADALMDLECKDVLRALQIYMLDPRSKYFPLPGQIREIIKPELSDEQLAIDASTRIFKAMSAYGYTNQESAKKYIGEIGWHIVEREGGWKSMCEKTHDNDLPILKAQIREMAKVFIARSRSMSLDQIPLLPGPKIKNKENDSNILEMKTILKEMPK